MRQKVLFILPWFLLAVVGAYLAASYGLGRIYFPVRGIFESPDGKHRIFEFTSMQDGWGHAPYGTNLSLTRKERISSPEDGYVIFGGYCKGRADVEWKGNTRVNLYCEQTVPANTQAIRVYGIDIQVIKSAVRSNPSLQGRRP